MATYYVDGVLQGSTSDGTADTVTDNQTFTGQVTFSNGTAPIISASAGPTSARQHTLPNVTSDTVALLAAAQTLSNKTLSSPTLSGTVAGAHSYSGAATFSDSTSPIVSAKIGPATNQQHTLPAVSSDTVALLAATQTLTGKTITSPTLSGTVAGTPTFSGTPVLSAGATCANNQALTGAESGGTLRNLAKINGSNQFSIADTSGATFLNGTTVSLNSTTSVTVVANGTTSLTCTSAACNASLPIRMWNRTTTEKNAIGSPTAGMIVFDTTLGKLCVYNGSAWETITSV